MKKPHVRHRPELLYGRTTREHGAEIEPGEVLKGFQTEAGQLVTFTPEEMRTLDVVESTRAVRASGAA